MTRFISLADTTVPVVMPAVRAYLAIAGAAP